MAPPPGTGTAQEPQGGRDRGGAGLGLQGSQQEGRGSDLVLATGRLPPIRPFPDHANCRCLFSQHRPRPPQLPGSQLCRHLPRTVFGNGRTHTGEIMGSGGSRLANYGARAQQATPQPAAEGGSVLSQDLLPCWEGGGAPGSGRGWVQLEVTLSVSLHPPGVTGLRVGLKTVLRLRPLVLLRLEVQPWVREGPFQGGLWGSFPSTLSAGLSFGLLAGRMRQRGLAIHPQASSHLPEAVRDRWDKGPRDVPFKPLCMNAGLAPLGSWWPVGWTLSSSYSSLLCRWAADASGHRDKVCTHLSRAQGCRGFSLRQSTGSRIRGRVGGRPVGEFSFSSFVF